MSASANDLGILYHCHLYHQLLIDLITGEGKQNILYILWQLSYFPFMIQRALIMGPFGWLRWHSCRGSHGAKPANLGQVLGIHGKGEGENQLHKAVL